MTTPARPLLMKIPAAARELGIGTTKMHELMNKGEIKRIRVGPNATRVPYAELEAYVERKLAETEAEQAVPTSSPLVCARTGNDETLSSANSNGVVPVVQVSKRFGSLNYQAGTADVFGVVAYALDHLPDLGALAVLEKHSDKATGEGRRHPLTGEDGWSR